MVRLVRRVARGADHTFLIPFTEPASDMGNRSFLYLGTQDQIDQGEGRPFADANNNFPTLWRLLLADGGPAAANEYQRVFGSAGTPNLACRASVGVARVRQLADGIRNHPLHGTQPYLDLHFASLLAYVEQEVAALGVASADDLYFSANIDELSWLDGDAPDDFVEKERVNCNVLATQVEAALAAENFPALDRTLEIDSDGATFADWRSWAWNFGFGGLDHPYFSMQDEPRTIPFADFVDTRDTDADDDENEPPLGNGLARLRENGRIGVVRTAVVTGLRTRDIDPVVIIPPEWTAVASARHNKLPLFWVTQGERSGLMRADETAQTLLFPCELDNAWDFERVGTQWLAVVRQGEHLGLLADDGRWIVRPDAITPPVTEIWAFTGEHAIAAAGEKQGVISATGAWTVPPEFDSIDELQESGIAIALAGDARRLVDVRSGEFRSEPFAAMQWLAWPGVFEGRQMAPGTTGWWRPDGAVQIAANWDSITLMQEKPWRARVVRDGRVGVRDRNDRELFAGEWSFISPRTDAGYDQIPGHLDEMVVGRAGRYGLIDGTGRELIPVRYDAVGNFAPMAEGNGEVKFHGPVLELTRETADERRFYGAWSLDLSREIIPCEYDHLYAVPLYREGGTMVRGFLAVRHAPGDPTGDNEPLRVGILAGDGTVLHETRYAWIAERYHVTEYVDATIVVRAIEKAWSADEPVKAALATEDYYVWLRRDGTVVNDLDVRTAQFAAGDFSAGHAIALQYRNGDGVPQDAALAQRWMLLAAGQPASVFDAPPPGLFRRLLGAKAPSPLVPSSPDARGDVQAMCDLVQDLLVDARDDDELAAARAWMEIAVTRGRGRGSAEAHMLLGYLLMEGIGGPADDARAHAISTQAAAMGQTTANFNLGVMYENGRGVPVDADKAIENFTVAAKAGDTAADLSVARILLLKESSDPKVKAKWVKQAVYHLQSATESATPGTAAAAQGELGRLYWTGTGVKKDRARAESLLRDAAAAGDQRAIDFLAEVQ